MRRWIPVGLIVLAIATYMVATVASSIALNDIVARPALTLSRESVSITVQQPGQDPQPDQARAIGGEGVFFGYRFYFQLPGDDLVSCTIRFRTLACADGWIATRPG